MCAVLSRLEHSNARAESMKAALKTALMECVREPQEDEVYQIVTTLRPPYEVGELWAVVGFDERAGTVLIRVLDVGNVAYIGRREIYTAEFEEMVAAEELRFVCNIQYAPLEAYRDL